MPIFIFDICLWFVDVNSTISALAAREYVAGNVKFVVTLKVCDLSARFIFLYSNESHNLYGVSDVAELFCNMSSENTSS